MIFEEKKLGTCHVVVDCSGTSNPKFYFDLMLFHLAHGKTRPQKTPKISKKKFPYFKLKTKRNLTKHLFYYFLGQKPFSPFLKNKKNTKQILILNSIFDNHSFR